jgi:hypothetical protein
VLTRPLGWSIAFVLLVLVPPRSASALKYRWPVKTGTDAAAKLAHPTKTSTVEALAKLTRPAGIKTTTKRLSPVEQTIYTVHGKLLFCRLEADGDYHVAIQDDSSDSTMVTEIPNPTLVGAGSPWKAQIKATRTAFKAKFHPTAAREDGNLIPVTITGVGLFDKKHDSAEAAANGVELHPILAITYP